MNPLRGLIFAVVLVIICASPHARSADLEAFLGLYEGSFESAFSEDPNDDLNFNPCDPNRRDCSVHTDPLVNILLNLTLDGKGKLVARFYRAESHIRSGRHLDLLGRGCSSSVGRLEKFENHRRAEGGHQWTARFDLKVLNRSCLGKLRPTSNHQVVVRGLMQSDGPRIEVAIDKAVVSQNYLYVKEDGKQRRIRLDLDNTQGKGRRAKYRVCIENELGEFTECVVTDKELKQVAFPLPVPGGVAVSYTWWYDLFPNLKRTRDLYELEQYTARFEKVP